MFSFSIEVHRNEFRLRDNRILLSQTPTVRPNAFAMSQTHFFDSLEKTTWLLALAFLSLVAHFLCLSSRRRSC